MNQILNAAPFLSTQGAEKKQKTNRTPHPSPLPKGEGVKKEKTRSENQKNTKAAKTRGVCF